MPDIDIDFCFERRQEVIDYVVDKYGQDWVVQIVTFGTMAARGVIRRMSAGLWIYRMLSLTVSQKWYRQN